MTTKQLIPLGNNGTPYFGVRILMRDQESYNKVIAYLENTAIKAETSEGDVLREKSYILDKEGKEIARTSIFKRIIELTQDVKPEIRSKIEKIIAGY